MCKLDYTASVFLCGKLSLQRFGFYVFEILFVLFVLFGVGFVSKVVCFPVKD